MKARWRILGRVWLFAFAVIAAVALFGPHQKPTRPWMHGRVVEVINDHTFGFQQEGKDFWFTMRIEGRQSLGIGQMVEVQPIAFTKEGIMKARVRQ
ncbi:hypothetical protein [Solidesulfovibrio sp. C21]|uniref:hypothetical protein n=1 Tax=Solidesulfovibrio sp. C21 TaxID=3398613 RepID=UPI0039FCB12E